VCANDARASVLQVAVARRRSLDGERRGEVAVGIDLREQLIGFLLDGSNRVSACNPAQRGCSWSTTVSSALASFAGSLVCLPLIASQAGRVCAVRSA